MAMPEESAIALEIAAGEFVEFTLVGCQRGSNKDFQPLDGEWRANFDLVLSACPDEIWQKLFAGVVRRRESDAGAPIILYKCVWDDMVNLFCHPRQLQEAVDWLNEVVAETNQLYRRRLELAEIWPTEEAEFEEQIAAALACVRLTPEPLFPSTLDEEE